MQRPNLVVCLVALLTFSAPAFAGGAPGSTGYPGGGAPGVASSPSKGSNDGGSGGGAQQGEPREGGPLTAEKLATIKTNLLNRMDEHIAELQKRKQCVQAATTGMAVRACMPNPRGHGGPNGDE